MKHLKQLVEYITGMDTRIGYPNEHLAGDSDAEIASPTYATAVGLLMNAVENKYRHKDGEAGQGDALETEARVLETVEESGGVGTLEKPRRSVFDKWADKLKEFLDNAE